MSMIDDIKEKVKNWEDEPCLTTEEAEYLLSKIEIAEEILEKMFLKDVWMLFDDNQVDAYKKIAANILQQLRS